MSGQSQDRSKGQTAGKTPEYTPHEMPEVPAACSDPKRRTGA